MAKKRDGKYKKLKVHPEIKKEHEDHYNTHIAYHHPDHNLSEPDQHEMPDMKKGKMDENC